MAAPVWALRSFVVVFATAHVLDALRGERDEGKRAYLVSLTFWALLLSVAGLFGPPPVAMAALTVNVMVAGMYYAVINRKQVSGLQFLLHGGVAIALLLVATCGGLSLSCSAPLSVLMASGFLLANAVAQLLYERESGRRVYPGLRFESPFWRCVLVPAVGGALALCLARSLSAAV